MNTPVSFPIAKLLKEKGFDEKTKNHYYDDGSTFIDDIKNSESDHDEFSAPTIAEVIMWLYEKHGIWISVKLGYGHEYVVQSTQSPFSFIYSDGTYNSPTEAYEAAIEYTLKNLI